MKIYVEKLSNALNESINAEVVSAALCLPTGQ